MLKKVKGGWNVVSKNTETKSGKKLKFNKKPLSKKKAEKRLRQVEYFKHHTGR